MSRVTVWAGLLIALSLTIGLVGCGTDAVTLIDDGADYTAEEALALPTRIDAGPLADAPSDESAERRHDALVDLRRQGPAGSAAATLITRTFPTDASGVPFYVERAVFESAPALIIVEAIGKPGGTLADSRVWVIDLQGSVLLSGTR